MPWIRRTAERRLLGHQLGRELVLLKGRAHNHQCPFVEKTRDSVAHPALFVREQ